MQGKRRGLLHTRAVAVYRDTLSEGFSHFVTSMTAPVASGWSGCRAGLTPTGKRRLSTAHTRPSRPLRFSPRLCFGPSLAANAQYNNKPLTPLPGHRTHQWQSLASSTRLRWQGCRACLSELKLWSNHRNDAFGEPILQLEYIAQFPAKAISPNMRPCCGVDQLADETQAVVVLKRHPAPESR
jgi:hypothetical protein